MHSFNKRRAHTSLRVKMVFEYTHGCLIYAWIADSVHLCIMLSTIVGGDLAPIEWFATYWRSSDFGIAIRTSECWDGAIVQRKIIEGSYRWFYTTTGIIKSAIVWGIRFIGTNIRLRGCHRPVGTDTCTCFSTGLFHKLSYSGWAISNARIGSNPR